MKVGHQRVDAAKPVSGGDENIRLARKRLKPPILVGGALDDARGGRADADDPAAALPRGVESFCSRSLDRAPLGMHPVVARILDPDGREGPSAGVKCSPAVGAATAPGLAANIV